MPTYEFRCPAGHEFERFYRSISAGRAEEPCPECGLIGQRQMSLGGALLFKGSGFYLTDYGKNAHRKSGPEKQGEGGKTGSGDASTAGKSEGSQREGGKSESGGQTSETKSDVTKSKSESRESKTESREPKAESRERKGDSREPKAAPIDAGARKENKPPKPKSE